MPAIISLYALRRHAPWLPGLPVALGEIGFDRPVVDKLFSLSTHEERAC